MSDTKPTREPPRISITPLEGRLYIVALLAAGYLVTWRVITPSTSVTAPIVDAARLQPPVVWLDDIPSSQRPALTLPPSWRLVSRGEPTTTAPSPRVTRAPASRPLRVRTRSS